MYEKEKLVHCFYIQRTFVCIKLITPFNSLDATDDNKNKSLSVFLTLFGNIISSCHFEKSTLNKTGNHVVLHRINGMHALIKFPEYIPYRLGVMAWTRSGTYGQMDGRTDGCTGRTGVKLHALLLFFE